LLYDMIGRSRREDAREVTIRALQSRFHVDTEQAERVEQTASALLTSVADSWSLSSPRFAQLLQWAARLHEVGLDIAHARYHLHGAYLLANADLPGFARLDQQLLSCLVEHHRRRLDNLSLDGIRHDWREPIFRLIVLLRLAVVMNRARSSAPLPEMQLTGGNSVLTVAFPRRWFGKNPLTHADLIQEQEFLAEGGFGLRLIPADD
jgi:exopolyphosphatase/guanosine-5'-triphosphate,3'-diphosphate pyrophosphatase